MELKVLTRHGIAEDSILSIRAGAMKRQAPITSGRAFRFPKLSMEDNPLRVAVLQQVASAYLVLKPGDGQYLVKFDSGASCEVAVSKETEGDEDSREAEFKEKREHAANATEAKEYLEQHHVLQFVQAVLQALIKERPSDPFAYMARHFTSGYSAQDVRSPPEVQEAVKEPAPPESAPPQEKASAAAPEALAPAEGSQDVPLLPRPPADPPDVEALRRQVHRTLLKANNDGTLHSSLEKARGDVGAQEAKPEDCAEPAVVDVSSLRLQVKHILVQAGHDGTLAPVVRKTLSGCSREPESTDQDLKRQVQQMLIEARRTGKLGSALEELRLKSTSEVPAAEAGKVAAASEAAGAAEPTPQDIRLHTKNTLLEAATSGKLASVLEGLQQDNSEAIRVWTRDTLTKAVANGALDGAIQKLLEDNGGDLNVQGLCKTVRDALAKAADEGSLEASVKSVLQPSSRAGESAEALDRRRVCSLIRATLLQASEDGSLCEALGKLGGQSGMAARWVLKDTLVQAFQDGALGPALQKVLVAG